VVSGSLPTLPTFAAAPPLPQGYQAPASGGGPQPVQAAAQLPHEADLSLPEIAPAGTGGPTASAASTGERGSSGSNAEGFSASYPIAKKGKIIGTPYVGTHTLGNWQSDNAVDIGVKIGTPMVALQDGVVVKVRHHPQGSGRFAGDQITIKGANGQMYFYAHGKSSVKAGQKLAAGEEIGTTGSANGVAHLHFAVEKGDPRKVIGQGR
jgi:murein DD-endopeptidase MepM/ murein hydrolase activator NlpD